MAGGRMRPPETGLRRGSARDLVTEWTRAHPPPNANSRNLPWADVVISLSLSQTRCPASLLCGKSKIPEIVFNFLCGREAPGWDSRTSSPAVCLPSGPSILNTDQFVSCLGLLDRPGEINEMEMIFFCFIGTAGGWPSPPGRTGDGDWGGGRVSGGWSVGAEGLPGLGSLP